MSTAIACRSRRSSAFCAAVAATVIDAEQDAAFGAGQARDQPVGPVGIGRQRRAAIMDRRGHHPVAGAQCRRQRARDADADDAARAGRQALELRFQARLIAATRHHLDAGAGENAPFALQPGDGEDHHMP